MKKDSHSDNDDEDDDEASDALGLLPSMSAAGAGAGAGLQSCSSSNRVFTRNVGTMLWAAPELLEVHTSTLNIVYIHRYVYITY
jgi:hypothetical protein